MNQEPHFEKKRRLTLLSLIALVWSLSTVVLSVLASQSSYINWDLSPYQAQGPHPRFWSISIFLSVVVVYGVLIGSVISFISLIAGLRKKPRALNVLVSCLSLLIYFYALLSVAAIHNRIGHSPVRPYVIRAQNLSEMLEEYAKEHDNRLPVSSNWYDMLIEFNPEIYHRISNRLDEKYGGLIDYAFNANMSEGKLAEVPKNAVLLFETPLAKNPAGGPELMSTNNHPIKGCFVLFADMHIAFVRAEDFNNLRWKP
jgi:hypothetical protein